MAYCGLILSRHEGRIAIVTNVGRDVVDAKMLETCSMDADGEIVWSWRPRYLALKFAMMLLASR